MRLVPLSIAELMDRAGSLVRSKIDPDNIQTIVGFYRGSVRLSNYPDKPVSPFELMEYYEFCHEDFCGNACGKLELASP